MIKRPAAFWGFSSWTTRLARQGMGMRIDILICTVLAAIVLSSPATTASERDRDDCSGNDPALMIRGCTQVIEDASESDSNRALALHMRGLAYVARGDNDRAITDYNEAIRLNPTYGLTFNERGLAYKAKGDVDRYRRSRRGDQA